MDTAGMLHRRGASPGAERVSHGCSTVTPGDVCAWGKGGSCAGVSVLREMSLVRSQSFNWFDLC